MTASSEKSIAPSHSELLQTPDLDMSTSGILDDVMHYHGRMLGRRTIQTNQPIVYQSLAHTTRDRLMERWSETRLAVERNDSKHLCYLSLEFLMGRLLRNALLSLGIEGEAAPGAGSPGPEARGYL